MPMTIDLTEQEIAELREHTNESDASTAVRSAIADYIRYARRMRLKSLSGQVEMQDNWRELEALETESHK